MFCMSNTASLLRAMRTIKWSVAIHHHIINTATHRQRIYHVVHTEVKGVGRKKQRVVNELMCIWLVPHNNAL